MDNAAILGLARGFGPADPVPVAVLSGDERQALPDPKRTGEADRELFGAALVQVDCRRGGVRRWLPVATCRACPFLRCASLVGPENRGGPERRWRIQCGAPVGFPLLPSGLPLPAEVRQIIEAGVAALRRTFTAVERRWFLGQEAAVTTCPEARARLGTWRLLGPACPVCQHYGGAVEPSRGLLARLGLRRGQVPRQATVQCTVPHGAALRRLAVGPAALGLGG